MSNSTDNLIEDLNRITFWIKEIILVLQIIFGTFGNLFNIIIFTRRTLRTNPCSMYFLASSIINLAEIYMIILLEYLLASWSWVPADTNAVWCKISNFLKYPIIALVLWFIVLSSFDRFLTSSRSAETRKLSSLSLAQKLIVFITIFFFGISVHILVFIRLIEVDGVTYCTSLLSDYVIVANIFFVMVCNVLPIILMTVFGILTILNVRQTRNRVVPHDDNARNGRMRTNDHQLIRMLLFQVLITVLISIPFCCLSMYNTFGRILLRQELSSTETALIDFTAEVLATLYLTNSVIGFYIYTLTGPKFRAEFKRCTRYGVKMVLTVSSIIRCLPFRIQRILLGEDPVLNLHGRKNNVRPIEQQQPMVMTTTV